MVKLLVKKPEKEAKRDVVVVAPDVKVALDRRAVETKQTLLRLVDDIFRSALALPPNPRTDPEVPEQLVPVVHYLKAVLAGKEGNRAASELIRFLVATAKNAGY